MEPAPSSAPFGPLVTGATGLIVRTIDTPLVAVGPTMVAPSAARTNQRPIVKVTKKAAASTSARLRGTAADDSRVVRVDVQTNGKVKRAKGTTRWTARPKLRAGRNRIVIRSMDDSGALSAPRRLTLIGK